MGAGFTAIKLFCALQAGLSQTECSLAMAPGVPARESTVPNLSRSFPGPVRSATQAFEAKVKVEKNMCKIRIYVESSLKSGRAEEVRCRLAL